MRFRAQDRDLHSFPTRRSSDLPLGDLPVDPRLIAVSAHPARESGRVRLEKGLGKEIDRPRLAGGIRLTGVLEPIGVEQRLPALRRNGPQSPRRLCERARRDLVNQVEKLRKFGQQQVVVLLAEQFAQGEGGVCFSADVVHLNGYALEQSLLEGDQLPEKAQRIPGERVLRREVLGAVTLLLP